MAFLSHPADDPRLAPLWAALFAYVDRLSGLFRPVGHGPGEDQVSLAHWREIRDQLTMAERQFRRLILPFAQALVPHLPGPPASQRGPQTPDLAPEQAQDGAHKPPDKPALTGAERPERPFGFRLHEPVGPSPDTPLSSDSSSTALSSTGPVPAQPAVSPRAWARPRHDPTGALSVSAAPEFRRFSRLLVALEYPRHTIHRLARILRRRARLRPAGEVIPWPTAWRPPRDLMPAGTPPARLDCCGRAGSPAPHGQAP